MRTLIVIFLLLKDVMLLTQSRNLRMDMDKRIHNLAHELKQWNISEVLSFIPLTTPPLACPFAKNSIFVFPVQLFAGMARICHLYSGPIALNLQVCPPKKIPL